MKKLLFLLFLVIPSLLWGQELAKEIPLNSTVDSIKQDGLQEKIRRLEDSLLVEKTRREMLEEMGTQPNKKTINPIDAIEKTPENVEEAIEDVGKGVGETVSNFRDILNAKKLITALIVVFLTWLLVRTINWFFKKMVTQFPNRRLEILRIQPIVTVVIWVVSLFSLIRTLFETENLWAAAGASGLALGIGLQDVVKNIFGGLMILVNRPFQVGDKVELKGSYGEVKKIGLQTTTINTSDDNLVTVPNAAIISDSVSNANAGALDCMVVVDLWLPVNIDVEKVRNLAFESAITSRYLNIDKPVTVLFFDHFDEHPATNVKIKAYVLDARYEKRFAGDVTEAAKKAFSEAGIYQK